MAAAKRLELLDQARQRVREAFVLFEAPKGPRGIAPRDVGDVLRCLGHNVTEAAVSRILQVRAPYEVITQ